MRSWTLVALCALRLVHTGRPLTARPLTSAATCGPAHVRHTCVAGGGKSTDSPSIETSLRRPSVLSLLPGSTIMPCLTLKGRWPTGACFG
eukprot:4526400-Prymnesium_polylepis.1